MQKGRYVPVLITSVPRRNPDYMPSITHTTTPMEKSARRRVPRYHVSLVKDVGSYWFPAKQVTQASEIAPLARHIIEDMGADREYMFILALDIKYQIIGLNLISMGSLTASIVHPREIFKALILLNAAQFICFHNHPSGDPHASGEDIEITQRLKAGGDLLGIWLADHIIVTDDNYTSMAKAGLI